MQFKKSTTFFKSPHLFYRSILNFPKYFKNMVNYPCRRFLLYIPFAFCFAIILSPKQLLYRLINTPVIRALYHLEPILLRYSRILLAIHPAHEHLVRPRAGLKRRIHRLVDNQRLVSLRMTCKSLNP